jgi:spermidine dehydrogenase
MTDSLGMGEPITRRDFVNGTLLAGAGLLLPYQAPTVSPADAFNGYGGIGDYRHSNGNTWDVLSAGHALRDGAFETRIANAGDTGEMYDLVAVGGGISGLAAAIFFQKYKGGRCLVLDNHAIFGGEAKRNEFLVDGQRLTAHQASAIFLVPKPGGYTARFYEMIGMDRPAFAYQTWRGPSPEMPLAHSPYERPPNYGFYFGPQFGQRPGVWVMDPWGRKLGGAPISDATRVELLRWGTDRVEGPRPQTEGDDVSRQLDSITLEEHLWHIRHQPRDGAGFSRLSKAAATVLVDVLSAYCNCDRTVSRDGDDALGDRIWTATAGSRGDGGL